MAFCQKCGAQLNPEAKFCNSCGTPAQNMSASTPVTQNVEPKAPKKPFNFKLLIIIAVALVVIAGGIVAAVQIISHVKEKKEAEERKAEKLSRTFSFEESIDFEFSGYDTAGTVEYELKEDIIDTITEKAKVDNPDSLIDSIYISTNYYDFSGLSNGDELSVEVWYDEDLAKKAKIYFTDEEFKVAVEGLDEISEVDPFEYIEWTQEGMDGSIYITVDWKDDAPEWTQNTYYSIDNNYSLSSGDEFTISLSYYELVDKYGIKFTSDSKSYTVGAADKNLEKISELTEDTIAAMQKEAIELIESDYESDSYEAASNLEYAGAYSYSSWGSSSVNLIFKGSITYTDSWFHEDGTYDAYYTVPFNSVIVKADGTQTYEIGYSSHLYESKDDLLNNIDSLNDDESFSITGEFAESDK